ncbi:MAG: NAD-dependent protein deacylase [Lachnospiraceae bacterium]|jgi:NAD-dependent deacetylase|uniref:NAD-dependent protein deacylase n=1 Tax=Eubacterium ramulus TaxID=39490 RepID=UPI0015AD7A93|nr:NAD-dependent protein deacylase [Eubacterium ramulus]MBS5191742.1 NAD-dependent protein deacylase [Lachnospiraceae bacterium]
MTGTEQLKQWIEASDNIVFFGGAGVSTESGIPDFRSVDGLYHQKYDYPPETILSHTFYMEKTEEFYKFYRDKMLALDAKPNAAHLKLAELEAKGKLKAVVTQNIDGLHQAAGSKNVLELHGSVHRNYCRKCGRLYDASYIKESTGVPKCACGGQIKPDVVLYEEGLDDVTMQSAIHFISQAEILIIGGTSLAVYPAAGLIDFYKGNKLVLINKSATPLDSRADLVIQAPIGEVFQQVC